jgi:SAM-dependent methyltransferase
MSDDHATTEQHWDARYAEKERMWSGRPNAALVRETSGLTPGTALDLGCGEGADAIWLAGRGWRVTGVDISGLALERAALHAEAEGVADRVAWRRQDLGEVFPEGEFDLVSAQFLHSRVELPREEILRRAADAVAPGGILLVVGHTEVPPGHHEGHGDDLSLPTAQEVLDSLALPDGAWEVLTAEEQRRPGRPDGDDHGHRADATLAVRRTGG